MERVKPRMLRRLFREILLLPRQIFAQTLPPSMRRSKSQGRRCRRSSLNGNGSRRGDEQCQGRPLGRSSRPLTVFNTFRHSIGNEAERISVQLRFLLEWESSHG